MRAVFIAALFTVSKMWEKPMCPSVDEWINKMWFVQTMKFQPALERNEILMRATTWMNFEHIMMSYISQTQKDQMVYVIHLYSVQKRQIQRDRKQNIGYWRLKEQEGESGVNVSWFRVSVGRVQAMDNGDGCTAV